MDARPGLNTVYRELFGEETIMRTKRVGTALVGLLVVVGWGGLAAAGPGFAFHPENISYGSVPNYGTMVGERFRLAEEIFVTHLGIYDYPGDGLAGTWNVGLWKCGAWNGTTKTFATMTQLASGTVGPIGSEAPNEDGCYYVSIGSPVKLSPTEADGTIIWYIVGASRGSALGDNLFLTRAGTMPPIITAQAPLGYFLSVWGSVPAENQPWTESEASIVGGAATVNPAINFKYATDITNAPPEIQSVTIEPTPLGSPTEAVVVCSDADGDNFTVTVTWGGDGTVVDPTDPTTYKYASAGVYDVIVTVDDGKGGTASSTAFAPVYDATAGFVTGGGWITTTEKSNFGFVCKYLNGATTPSGQLQFKDGGMNFQCTAYDWLVVEDDGTAQFAGVGSINGEGSYFFIADITDEQDRFQIQVYDTGYDSNLLPLGGGQIKIHQK